MIVLTRPAKGFNGSHPGHRVGRGRRGVERPTGNLIPPTHVCAPDSFVWPAPKFSAKFSGPEFSANIFNMAKSTFPALSRLDRRRALTRERVRRWREREREQRERERKPIEEFERRIFGVTLP